MPLIVGLRPLWTPAAFALAPIQQGVRYRLRCVILHALHALAAPYFIIYKFSVSPKTGPSDATSGGNGVPGMIKNDETDLPQQ
jgi:hypothetical protein